VQHRASAREVCLIATSAMFETTIGWHLKLSIQTRVRVLRTSRKRSCGTRCTAVTPLVRRGDNLAPAWSDDRERSGRPLAVTRRTRRFAELSAIKEEDGVPKAQDMIRLLVEGHETVARTARTVFKTSESANDQPTCDRLTQRMQLHEMTAWMRRSLLQ
jgi:hypothetical protein